MPTRPTQKKRKSTLRLKKLKKSYLGYFKIISLFFISVSFLSGLYLYNFLNQVAVKAFDGGVVSWDIRNRDFFVVSYTVVSDITAAIPDIVDHRIMFFDVTNKKVISYSVPDEVMLNMPGRFGDEQYKNIFYIANLDAPCPEACYSYLNRVDEKLFGTKIDRFLVTDQRTSPFFDEMFGGGTSLLKKELLNGLVFDLTESNLGIKEVYYINKLLGDLPIDRVYSRELTPSYLENLNLLNDEIKDITFGSVVSKNNTSITVLNASDIPGVAGEVSRVISNYGGRVISIENAPFVTQDSFVLVSDTTSEEASFLKYVFGIDITVKNDYALSEKLDLTRSDLIVVIGVDLAESL